MIYNNFQNMNLKLLWPTKIYVGGKLKFHSWDSRDIYRELCVFCNGVLSVLIMFLRFKGALWQKYPIGRNGTG